MKRIYQNNDIEFDLRKNNFNLDISNSNSVTLTFFTKSSESNIIKHKEDIKNGIVLLEWKDLGLLEEGILHFNYNVSYPSSEASDSEVNKVDNIMTDYLIMSGVKPIPEPENKNNYYTKEQVDNKLLSKQDQLTSGKNIATINSNSLLEGKDIKIDADTIKVNDGSGEYSLNEFTKDSFNLVSSLVEHGVYDTNILQETGNSTTDVMSQKAVTDALNKKQNTLVSGTNIKTINNQSILGKGNINIEGGAGGTSDYSLLTNKPTINSVELNGNMDINSETIEIGYYDDPEHTLRIWEPLNDFCQKISDSLANKQEIGNYVTETELNQKDYLTQHQDIKTINSQPLTGKGDILINSETIKVGYSDSANPFDKPETALNTVIDSLSTRILNNTSDIKDKRNNIPVIESPDTNLIIDPNKYYKWGEVASLTIQLYPSVNASDEFIIEFQSGSQATKLMMPDTIKWVNGKQLIPEANKTYVVSIVNNLAVGGAF